MGKKVLIVDDDEAVLGAVEKALHKDGYDFDTALSADEALNLLASGKYNLIITDLMMPGIDGLELLSRTRNLQPDVPAIMITGYPTIQTALHAKRLGAFEYVTKPFTRQELRSVTVRAMRVSSESASKIADAHPETYGPVYYLPGHSWAGMEKEGNVKVGIAAAFASLVGEIQELQLPRAGDALKQGHVMAVIRAADEVEHSIHSPLSGRVLEVNRAVMDDSGLAIRDPEGAGWLIQLEPQDLKHELGNLEPA